MTALYKGNHGETLLKSYLTKLFFAVARSITRFTRSYVDKLSVLRCGLIAIGNYRAARENSPRKQGELARDRHGLVTALEITSLSVAVWRV